MRRLPLVLIAVPALYAQDADLPERLFRSGERAYATHAYAEALDTWNQLIQQAPTSPFAAHALMNLARHQMEVAKQPDAALALLERIKTEHLKSPWAAEAMLLRGRILASRSHAAGAQGGRGRIQTGWWNLFPDHPCVQQARFELGQGFRLLGQWAGRCRATWKPCGWIPPPPWPGRPSCRRPKPWTSWATPPAVCACCRRCATGSPRPRKARKPCGGSRCGSSSGCRNPPCAPWASGPKAAEVAQDPTLLATGPAGELYLFQDDLDQASLLKDGQLTPAGPPVKSARAMVASGAQVWLVTRQGVTREGVVLPGTPAFQAPAAPPWTAGATSGSATPRPPR